eukprot:Plantae.Rhodophyta-Purpureofilum_apyrenoidigerum.ctg13346.p1 GENE.Plantae.Rhodophyta-Purpureofilum_apyrenoidigerum.ctg13346~~Plantae.Rhodophyta-Purpureofilum_apyrenoidigerum.ctg13346.p1  ORF type:complete len:289 (-),score=50.68 Plantae.Rhodophyta-Purpureofilum_apyrenoidigerum.ctg13346:49-915(-)
MVRVVYQGLPGAYSEAAAIGFFGKDIDLVACNTFDDVFENLVAGKAERAALPIENSLAGTIHKNLDKLVAHENVHIVGELDFRVRHCLLKLKNQDTDQIKRVFSHPMALAQCERYMSSKGYEPVESFDTAGIASQLPTLGPNAAAIASRRAAQLYDLDIVEESIEDDKENYTRFLILSMDSSSSEKSVGPRKTSIAFTLNNDPGVLCKALSVFSVLNVDMTKIESRHVRSLHSIAPTMKEEIRWGYIFYIDVAADYHDPSVKKAFYLLQEITPYFRLLGSYPRHSAEE